MRVVFLMRRLQNLLTQYTCLMKGYVLSKFYAGIGSRQTPKEILELMALIGARLEKMGWTLRSGGANGADSAFATHPLPENMEVYLPWSGFNNIQSNLVGASPRAMEIAEGLHPAWNMCSQGAKKLHGRNVHQVLGKDIDPKTYSSFVICWTPNGAEVGGTATAIRLAKQVGIRVLNLANLDDLNHVIASLDIK